jgi:hypothetical protein
MKRAKRAIIASQGTRRFARLAQILQCAKNACFRMTIKLHDYPMPAPRSSGATATAPSFPFCLCRLTGADFYSHAVRSRDPQTIVIRSRHYRLRSAFIAFIEGSTGRRLITISVSGIGWYPPPLIYAFHRFSVHVTSRIFEFTALTRKILSAW